ncbi:hypothetical protein MSAN_01049600 [Mycena sanguinolenta]|uniref:Uncharacterized protein n=1 Tax=Mycena sanguinolenta TaxID=230812 RepID=A0A8H6YMM3_9AGAR|nr:hypothetical protein MSAN_01049600 [Mycena sanguinolenta]
MSLQSSHSHPAQLESLHTIAPRTTDEIVALKKRKTEDAITSMELPKAKKQRREQDAYCPLCHRMFAGTTTRNKHMGISICLSVAKKRKLVGEFVTPEEWKVVAETRKESMSSNKLVHLKESSDKFQKAENVAEAASGRSTPAFLIGSSSEGILSPGSEAPGVGCHRRVSCRNVKRRDVWHMRSSCRNLWGKSRSSIRSRDQQWASILERVLTEPIPCSQSVQLVQERPRLQGSASLEALPGHSSAPRGQLAFSIHEPPQPSAGESEALKTASSTYYASQPPSQMEGLSRSASRSSCNGDVNARSSTPSQMVHFEFRAECAPKTASQASPQTAGPSRSPSGSPSSVNVNTPSGAPPQLFHSCQLEYASRMASPASQPASQTAGPSQSSSSGDVTARSGTPSQLFHSFQGKPVSPAALQVAGLVRSSSNGNLCARSGMCMPSPHVKTDTPDHRAATPLPPNPQTILSTSAQPSPTAHPQSLQFESSHIPFASNASNEVMNVPSASEASAKAMPTPANNAWDVQGHSRVQSFCPAPGTPINPFADNSWLMPLAATPVDVPNDPSRAPIFHSVQAPTPIPPFLAPELATLQRSLSESESFPLEFQQVPGMNAPAQDADEASMLAVAMAGIVTPEDVYQEALTYYGIGEDVWR